MSKLYSRDGFEKISKVLIANLRAVALFLGKDNIFKDCIGTLSKYTDLIYGTLILNADFIHKDKKNVYHVQLPKRGVMKNKEWTYKTDWSRTFYGIGSFFGFGKFLQDNQLSSFSRCAKLANRFGSIRVFNFSGQPWIFNNIPILSKLWNSPKDFFVFLGSIFSLPETVEEMHRDYKKSKKIEFINLTKLINAIGKIILISASAYMKRGGILLTTIDVITQNASLINLILKNRKAEKECLLTVTSHKKKN